MAPNTHRDEKDPLHDGSNSMPFEVDVSLPSFQNSMIAMEAMRHAITHDSSVTAGMLQSVNRSIDELQMNIGARRLAIADIEHDEEIAKTLRILGKIERGETVLDDFKECIFLTDAVAEKLGTQDYYLNLNFPHLQVLTDRQAELLSAYNGMLLKFEAIIRFSDAQIHHLARCNVDTLSIGVPQMTDAQVQSLATFPRRLSLNGLTSITDDQMRILATFEGPFLELSGLTSLSDAQVEILTSATIPFVRLLGIKNLTTSQKKLFEKHPDRFGFKLPTVTPDDL